MTTPARSRPPILAYLADAANLVTLTGVAFGVLGIIAALHAELLLAAGLGVWAVVADCVDGPVARRDLTRTDVDRAIGINLDSLADVVCSGVLPAVVLVQAGDARVLWVVAAVAVVVSGVLRLAYFNVHGAAGGFEGLPIFYAPVVVATVLVVAAGDAGRAAIALLVVLVAEAGFQVAPVRVGDLRGGKLVGFLAAGVALSAVLFVAAATEPSWVDPALVGRGR